MPDWEIRAYGIPEYGLDAVHRREDSDEWTNMEEGGAPPSDTDIANAHEVVIYSDGVYYTVTAHFINDLETLYEYVDDVFLQEYEDGA